VKTIGTETSCTLYGTDIELSPFSPRLGAKGHVESTA